MNKLYIDTRDNGKIIIRLRKDDKEFVEQSEAVNNKAQAALPLVQKVLEKAGISPVNIEEIEVETGPGSFTGLRVGVSIANAMSFAASVKINGKDLSELETPEY